MTSPIELIARIYERENAHKSVSTTTTKGGK
jgi:hypothetical protein